MADLIKNALYTGVGAAAIAVEKAQDIVEDMVSQRKASREEGKKLVSEFLHDTTSKKDELESKLTKIVEEVVGKFDFITGKDITGLRDRVEELESKLKAATKAPARKTRKATTSKAEVK